MVYTRYWIMIIATENINIWETSFLSTSRSYIFVDSHSFRDINISLFLNVDRSKIVHNRTWRIITRKLLIFIHQLHSYPTF